MEMEFRDTSSRRRRMFLYLGVALAVVAGLLAYSLATQGTVAEEPPPMRAVLIATRDIPARTALQAIDVMVREVHDDPALLPALSDPEQVVGRVTTVPLLDGQVVYPNVMVTAAADAPFTILGPGEQITDDSPYWRAVSVRVPPEHAVGGAIMTGQRVDLLIGVEIEVVLFDDEGNLFEVPSSEGYQSGRSTRIAIQDLEVLESRSDEGIYILKVNAEQAEEIYHAAHVAPNSFSLALRPDGDTRPVPVDGYGETNDRIIMQYLYPVPRMLDLFELTKDELVPYSGQPMRTPDPAAPPQEPPAAPQPQPTPEPEEPSDT